jgi:AcrR family transcriptional regulator
MARPQVIRDEDIIHAARRVFLERGFRATSAEVAERAGVSEGSIFKRFKTKFDLFRAAMIEMEEPAFLAELAERLRRGNMREQLVQLGMDLVEHFRVVTPLSLMAWSTPGDDGLPCMASEPNPPPLRLLRAISGYFEGAMRSGQLRRHDPEVAARTFLGSVHNYVVFELLFNTHEELPLPAETYVRGLVQLFWVGTDPALGPSVQPTGPESQRASRLKEGNPNEGA